MPDSSPQAPTAPKALSPHRPRRALLFFVCVVIAAVVAAWFRPDRTLSPAALRALFILVLAVLLWVTELIPAFAVGLLVIGLSVALLGRPAGVYARNDTDWQQFVLVFGHPLIWLFFGGFVLAAGMSSCGLDRRLAFALLRRVGGRYQNVLLGTMLATFVLSMFMSNTATTAMLLAVLAPMLGQAEAPTNSSKGLLLGIGVAAALGGMGSLIGTPPNAIAVASLSALEPPRVITFFDWALIGLPPAAIGLLGAWRLLLWLYPDPGRTFTLASGHQLDASQAAPWKLAVVSTTVIATVLLWLTASWHGIPTAAVSLLPIVVFTSTGIVSTHDVRGLNYDVLFLMAGGLALGNVVTATGLSDWMIAKLPLENLNPYVLALVMTYVTVVLSNFMSATAAANILIPLTIAMASGSETIAAIGVAIGASCGLCLPVATPPNAMIFATGRLRTWDLVRVGLVVGLVMPLLALSWLWIYTTQIRP